MASSKVGNPRNVADKRRVRRTMKDLQRIKTWQLLVLLLLVGFIAATFLRLNNIGMVERRTAVVSADEAGDQDVLIKRLYDLQQYVSSHMNTDMGSGVPLQASYDRAVDKAINDAVSGGESSGNIYKIADDYCAPQFSAYSTAYLNCFLGQLEKYPTAAELIENVEKPSPELYVHDFASPVWSPDFAGWSLVICAVLVLMIIARLVGLAILRVMLHRHYRHI
ncbi:MAG: hypothetical protein WAV04_01025 [Candidatus Microsaccharimonas sp.]